MASGAWQLIEQTKKQKINNNIKRNSDKNIYSINTTHSFLVISLSFINVYIIIITLLGDFMTF